MTDEQWTILSTYLPRSAHRGHAVRDAINAGATKTGVTIHVVDNGVDTGPKIAQREVQITPEDSEAELHERIKVVERELLVATVKQIAEKQINLNEIK